MRRKKIAPRFLVAIVFLLLSAVFTHGRGAAQASPTVTSSSQAGSDELLVGDEADYYPTPKGAWVHKSCFHRWENGWGVMPNGDIVDANKNIVEHRERCKYKQLDRKPSTFASDGGGTGKAPVLNGNVEWLDDKGTVGNGMIDTVWEEVVVPNAPPPSQSPTIYIWNGLSSTSDTTNLLLQPVLQYSLSTVPPNCSQFNSPTGWSMINYYIDHNGTPTCGNVQFVKPGDLIDMAVSVDMNQPCNNGGTNCSYGIGYAINSGSWFIDEFYSVPLVLNQATLGSLEVPYGNNTTCTVLPPAQEPQYGVGILLGIVAITYGYPNWNSQTAPNGNNNSLSPCWGQNGCPPIPGSVPPDCGWGIHLNYPNVALNYHN